MLHSGLRNESSFWGLSGADFKNKSTTEKSETPQTTPSAPVSDKEATRVSRGQLRVTKQEVIQGHG